MKTQKLIIGVVLLSAIAVAIAQEIAIKSAYHIKAMQEDGSIAEVINQLCDRGIVCQIRKHKWQVTSDPLVLVNTLGIDSNTPAERHTTEVCLVCKARKVTKTTQIEEIHAP